MNPQNNIVADSERKCMLPYFLNESIIRMECFENTINAFSAVMEIAIDDENGLDIYIILIDCAVYQQKAFLKENPAGKSQRSM